MARTYTNTPEPRYVEKAKTVENGGGGGGNTIVMYADAEAVQACISDPTQQFTLYSDIELTSGYDTLEQIPDDGYFVCKVVMSGQVVTTIYPIIFSGAIVTYILTNQNNFVTIHGKLLQPQH